MRSKVTRSAAWRSGVVGSAALVSGIGSYVLLIVVAQNATSVQYADFAVFWALSVTVGLGFYYPLEQETAREVAGSPRSLRGSMVRFILSVAVGLTAITALGSLLLFTPAGEQYIGNTALVVGLVATFAAYAIQFPVRGMLSGSARTTGYSSVVAVEGILRVLLPLLLVVVGLTSTFAFSLVVAVAAAASVIPVLAGRDRTWLSHGHADRGVFISRVTRLIVAAFAIQFLLNSGTLLARLFVEGADAALAGQILACLSIARIPVFAYQVLQIFYLPLLARQWKANDGAAVRRILTVALLAAAAVGAAIVGGMSILGGWVTGLMFGADLVPSPLAIVLISLGVALFMVALVASDGAIAIGRHTLVVRSWIVAVAVAAVPAVMIPDTLLRVTAPLIVGALAAFVQLGAGILRAYAQRDKETAPSSM